MNRHHPPIPVAIERLPKHLQQTFLELYSADHPENSDMSFLEPDNIYCGDARQLLPQIEPNSIALSVWSPPYFVGKEYEEHLSFD
ncbi:MAG: site-specific DNA-methyltransferase, partial [Roseiflexus sp.]|nr:site-specific DNA-methyltransferase [Roseiflexus sp.]